MAVTSKLADKLIHFITSLIDEQPGKIRAFHLNMTLLSILQENLTGNIPATHVLAGVSHLLAAADDLSEALPASTDTPVRHPRGTTYLFSAASALGLLEKPASPEVPA